MSSRTITVFLVCAVVLSGCARVSESRFNPFNWFGGGNEEERVAVAEDTADPRPLVAEVTSLAVERTPTGAIIRATGLPPRQGWHTGELVPDTDGPVGGVLSYRFRAVPPFEPTRVSTERSRELSVAVAISQITLSETRVIQVIGARNVRTTRR